jgi:hypothetical protein
MVVCPETHPRDIHATSTHMEDKRRKSCRPYLVVHSTRDDPALGLTAMLIAPILRF